MRSEERLRAVERATDPALMALAIALVPLLLLPEITDLPEAFARSFLVADYLIWAVFAAVFAAKIAVAPHRLAFVRANWLEAAMVALPMLRPLRVVRLLRFARLATALGFNTRIVKGVVGGRGTQSVALVTVLIVGAGAVLVLAAERDSPNANIGNFGDALWWAVVTVTTVGYGDHFPVTPAGRGVAFALMLVGIAVLSTLTASIAAFIVREHEDVELSDIMQELRELRREVRALRGPSPEDGPGGPG